MSNAFIAFIQPPDSEPPQRFSTGIRISSNVIERVSEHRCPILFSFLPKERPGVPASTIKPDIPLYPASGSVLANMKNQSALPAPVIHIFEPLMTYSSPSLTAIVLQAATSEPAPGSVIAYEAIAPSSATIRRYLSFCS